MESSSGVVITTLFSLSPSYSNLAVLAILLTGPAPKMAINVIIKNNLTERRIVLSILEVVPVFR